MMIKRISALIFAICLVSYCGLFDALAYSDTVVMTVGYDDFEEYRRCLGVLNEDNKGKKAFSLFSVFSDTEESEFSLKRLILSSDYDLDFYGAKYVIKGFDGIQIMQYDTVEETEYAYNQYKNSELVDYVEPDITLTADTADGEMEALADSFNSWGYGDSYIGMSDFFSRYLSGKKLPRVVVAVIDTGIDSDHEMFSERLVTGYNYIEPSSYPEDDSTGSHGTHVSGIVCDGTKTNVKIMPLKAMDQNGSGNLTNITAAIRDAAYNGADIINLSIGGMGDYSSDSALAKAISYAAGKGALIVTAAGNESHNIQSVYPAAFDETIAVANMTKDYTRYSTSNYGDRVDLSAPGDRIWSSQKTGGYKFLTGTSMACPHVSACAAALMSYDKTLNKNDIKTLLKANAYRLSDSENYRMGAGMVKMSDFSFDAVALDKKEITLCEGASVRLNADVYSNKGISWYSGDEGIVTVNDGVINAVSEGTAYVYAQSGDFTADCEVRVTAVGDWYKNGGYEIKTADELMELSSIVNSGLDDFKGKTVTLKNDINMSGIDWIPIGYRSYTDDTEYRFLGTFNGNGYTISDLTSTTFRLYQGLFGIIGSGASVQNVNLKNVNIVSEQSAGGIAGRNDGKIQNCSAEGSITSGRTYIANEGGITAENYGVVSDCAFYGTLSTNSTKSDTKTLYSGGISAQNYGAIINCSAKGIFPSAISGVSLYNDAYAAKNSAMLIEVEDDEVSAINGSDTGEVIAAVYDDMGVLRSAKKINDETKEVPNDRAYIKFFLWNDMEPLSAAVQY